MKYIRNWGRPMRLLLLLALVFCTLTLTALAAEPCGSSAEWSYDSGKLTITGTGDIYNYPTAAPWGDYAEDITTLTVSQGITGIGEYAFAGCTALQDVTLPSSLTWIGSYAFDGCTALTQISLPESVSDIGSYAFANSGLTGFTFPAGFEYVQSFIFDGAVNLKSITFPESVAYMDELFETEKDYALQSLFFQGPPVDILPGAFLFVDAKAYYDPNAGWDDSYMDGYGGTIEWVPILGSGTCGTNATWLLAGDVLTISGTGAIDDYTGDSPAPWSEYNDSIVQVIIEEGITGIGNSAFQSQWAIEQISLPESLRFIGSDAFSWCSALKEITLPSQLTAIYDAAFRFSSLTSIVIPDSVTTLGAEAFYCSLELRSCTLPSNLEQIPDYFFESCPKLESIHIPASVNSIGSRAFEGCTALDEVYIDDLEKWCSIDFNGLTNIMPVGYTLYLNGEPVTDLVIPESITSLPWNVFSNCTSIKSLDARSLQIVGNNAFFGCTALETVYFSDQLTSLSDSSFYNCTSLKTLQLPAYVEEIGSKAFAHSGLTELYFNGPAPSLTGDFLERVENLKIYYPENDPTWTDIIPGNYGAIDPEWIAHEVIIPGTSPDNAVLMTPNSSYITKLPSGDVTHAVYNKITLDEPGLVSFYIEKSSIHHTNKEFEVTVCDENGTEIWKHNPYFYFSGSHTETHAGLLAGTYYLNFTATKSGYYSETLNYYYNFTPMGDVELEGNNTNATATALEDCVSLVGYVSDGDTDYYSMTLENPSTVTVSISELQIADNCYDLYLVRENTEPQRLSMEDFYLSGDVHCMDLTLPAGTHYLYFKGHALGQQIYYICAAYSDVVIPENDGSTPEKAVDMTLDQYISADLSLVETDFYARFTIPENGYILVETSRPMENDSYIDLEYAIVSEDGKRIYWTDASENVFCDTAQDLNSFEVGLPAGTYLLHTKLSAPYRDNMDFCVKFFPASAELEPNGTPQTATPLPFGQRLRGCVSNEKDYYRIDTASSMPVLLTVSNYQLLRANGNSLTLRDSNNKIVKFLNLISEFTLNEDGSYSILLSLDKGTHYLELSGGAMSNYELMIKAVTCSEVGHTVVTINKITPTCKTSGYTGDQVCMYCSDYVEYGETISMTAHTWSEWITVYPTFTHSGFGQRKCTVCGQVEEKTIPKLEHENPFVDVKKDAWYHNSVLWAYENDITTGTDDTHFSPDTVCTRGQVVTFLWRAMTDQQKSHGENPFTDVAKTDYFFNSVLWAEKNDITEGTSATTFSPALSCTRAQVVTFLWRASGCPTPESATTFADVPAGTWYSDAVLWAKETGITDGTGSGLFSPDAECSRSQIVTFLCRWMAPSEANLSN